MADLQPGSLPTTFTVGADADYALISRGAQTGRMLRSEMLADVPRILIAAEISGNTAITAAAHANRVVNVTAAATCPFAAPAGFTGGEEVMFVQQAAGALTLTGDVELAPGVASATTNGPASVLVGIYSASRAKLILYHRTAAAAGGAGNVTLYGPFTASPPQDANENIIVNSASIGGAIPVGSLVEITVVAIDTGGSPTAGGAIVMVRLNGTGGTPPLIAQFSGAGDGIDSRVDDMVMIATGAAAQLTSARGSAVQGGIRSTTVDTSGANTLTVSIQRTGTLTRPLSHTVFVRVTRA